MIIRRFCLNATFISLIILGLSVSGSVYGAEKYRVGVQVFHLGELIAQPVLDVVAGKTTGGEYSVPGERRYTFVVLLRPMTEDKVSVSMQFSSGKVDIQPNLLVDIGEEVSATIDKVLLKLIVVATPQPSGSGRVALRE